MFSQLSLLAIVETILQVDLCPVFCCAVRMCDDDTTLRLQLPFALSRVTGEPPLRWITLQKKDIAVQPPLAGASS